MKQSAVALTQQRLEIVATQFTRILQAAQGQLIAAITRVATDSAVVKYMRAPSAGNRGQAAAALARLTGGSTLQIVQLWDTTPRLMLAMDSARGPGAFVPQRSVVRPPPDSAVITPFEPRGDSLVYVVAAPVRATATPIGTVVLGGRINLAGSTRDQLGALLGGYIDVYIGNADGAGWTNLQHIVPAPGFDVRRAPPLALHERAGVGRVYAVRMLVAGTPWAVVVESPAQLVLGEARKFLNRLLLIGGAVLALGLLGTLFLSAQLTRPIARLTRAAERVAAGDYHVPPASGYTSDELGRLSRSFDTMVSRVRDAIEARRASERRMLQFQKMEAVGQLASGIAHDFNNLLTVIISYSELLAQDFASHDRHRADVEAIQNAARSAATLTRQLLIFSRQQVVQPRTMPLGDIITATSTLLKRLIGEDIDVAIDLDPAAGIVRVDPGQMEQVIVNLAVNARDAMPAGGRLTIATRNVEFHGTATEPAPYPDGRYVALTVSDTGVGISAETQARMFEPFFTTKEPGKGTGLGLATVYGIVQQSAGHIGVYSEPGKGATFKIYLPRVDEAEYQVEAQAPTEMPTGTETILVAEDQSVVREIMFQLLRRQGYDVIQTPDGHTAVAMAESAGKPIHLLITDVIMPHMGGRAVADRVSELHPGVKVLFVSGYTDDTIVHRGVLESGVEYLEKPFGPIALVQRVRRILDTGVPYRRA